MAKEKKKKSVGRKILDVILCILLALLVLFAGLLIWLSVTEYKPAETENVKVTGTTETTLSEGDSINILTWNVGYGALGDNADFFMEGGEMVKSATEERVQENMKGIVKTVQSLNPDVAFFQEVDSDSTRSYHIDETAILDGISPKDTESDALYYSVAFVPYPVPPIGEVHTNLQTLSKFPVTQSTRVQLPVPFSWPIRTANLKRCLMVNRVPLKNSSKELVLVNLHLEAYDDGEGKVAQTKKLLNILETEYKKGNYVVAAGDFNQTFSNVDNSAYPTLSDMWEAGVINVDDFAPNFSLYMDSSVPTCRSLYKPYADADHDNFQYYMIDGFIVSANMTVQTIETIDCGFVNSDHNPVVMSAMLNETVE